MSSNTPQEPRAVLRIFNPRRLDDRTLEDSFIARQEQFALIRSDILGTESGKAPQHHLIIGQRGMGKTTLLCRIAVELRRDENRNSFIPLAFPEELHVSVDRLSDLWLACLDALADALEAEHRTAAVRALDEKIAVLAKPGTEETAKAESCRAAFYETLAADGRRAVLLLDNFHSLLQRLKAHDYTLRKVFTQPDAPLIVAASPLVPAEEGDYKAAFLDQFKVHHLYRLSLEEMQSVMRRLAEVEGRPDLARRLYSEGPRLATLRDLTGGNPRTAVLLYRHFTRGFGADPYEDLEALLDDITALYQSRIDQLSDQAQKLIALIAQHWRPITAEKLTETAALPRGSVTGQINRLLELGMIEPVSLHGSKKTGYQIAERFLNVWFLMRHSTRRARGSIAALTRFLETLYSPAELREIASAAVWESACDASRSRYHLALAQAVKEHDGHLAAELSGHAQAALAEIAEGVQDRLAEIIHPSEIEPKFMEFAALKKKLASLVPAGSNVSGDEFADLVLRSIALLPGRMQTHRGTIAAQIALDGQQIAEVIKTCAAENEELTRKHGEQALHFIQGRMAVGQITSISDADEWKRALEVTESASCCGLIAKICESVGNVDLAIGAYRKGIRLNESDPWLWDGLGELLSSRCGQHLEAAEAFKKAISLDSSNPLHWMRLGFLQQEEFKNYSDAEYSYRQAIAIKPSSPLPHIGLALLLQECSHRYHEALESYHTALALSPETAYVWKNLGLLLMNSLLDYQESERAYRRSIELDPADPEAWLGLGVLLHEKLGRYKEAEECYRQSVLLSPELSLAWKALALLLRKDAGRCNESEMAFRKALSISPESSELWNELGCLQVDCMGSTEAAEESFRESLRIDPENEFARHNLVYVLRDIRRNFSSAREVMSGLKRSPGATVAFAVHEALFAAHADNWGTCAEELRSALRAAGHSINAEDMDDCARVVAVLLELHFGEKLLALLREEQADVKLMPWYEAIAAHHAGDRRFLQNIPAEARSAAEKLFDEIERRRAVLRKAWNKDQSSAS